MGFICASDLVHLITLCLCAPGYCCTVRSLHDDSVWSQKLLMKE